MAKQLLKTLLLLCASMACTAAWADDEEEETTTTDTSTDYISYTINADDNSKQDITYTFNNSSTLNTTGVTIDSEDTVAYVYNGSSYSAIYKGATAGLDKFGFGNAAGKETTSGYWLWRQSGSYYLQFRGQNSTDYGSKYHSGFAILDLSEGDVVTINGSGFYPSSTVLFSFPGAYSVDGESQSPNQYSDATGTLQEATYTVEGLTTGSQITINVESDGYVASYVGGYMYMAINSIVITSDVDTDNFDGCQTYTLKYVYETTDEDGNTTQTTLKEVTCYATSDETTATATDAEMATFYDEETETYYSYSSGNETITLTGEDDVITLVFSAANYVFDIDAMCGETKLADYVYERTSDNSYTIDGNYITQFILYDDTYYRLSDENVSNYSRTFTAESEGEAIYSVEYEEADNVVYYAEDTDQTYAYINYSSSLSGGSSAMYATGKTMMSGSVEAGYYNVVAYVSDYTRNQSHYYCLDGTQVGLTQKPTYDGEWSMIINAVSSGTISMVASWSSDYYDYFYIEKITDQSYTVSVTSLGIASFCAPVNVTVPEGITVYSASLDDEKTTLTLSKVSTDVIPANTGVILQGSAGDYKFEQTDDESSEDFDDNDLIAACATATASTTLTASSDTTYYALTQSSTGTSSAVFGKIKGSVTITNKAYLRIIDESTSTDDDDTESTEAKTIKIVFAETSGIESVSSEKQTDGSYYNLQGVKVLSPSKGLYIKDGKKVIIK